MAPSEISLSPPGNQARDELIAPMELKVRRFLLLSYIHSPSVSLAADNPVTKSPSPNVAHDRDCDLLGRIRVNECSALSLEVMSDSVRPKIFENSHAFGRFFFSG